MVGRKPKVIIDRTVYKKSKEELEIRDMLTPKYASQEFQTPSTLSSEELKIWEWLVRIFRETKNCAVSDCDVHLMELYCRAKSASDYADKMFKEDPSYYVIVKTGEDDEGNAKTTAKVNPYYKMKQENAALCIKLFDQLGLSPLARAKAGVKRLNSESEEDLLFTLNSRKED